MCLLGLNDEEISQILDIDTSTLYCWKEKYPELSKAMQDGKDDADAKVARAFYNRALGYEYNETTYEKIDTSAEMDVNNEGDIEETKKEIYKRKVVTKHLPPDPQSAITWLKNRQKDKWRDRVDHVHDHTGTVNMVFGRKEENKPLEDGNHSTQGEITGGLPNAGLLRQ